MFDEQIFHKYQQLQNKLTSIEKKLAKLPAGKIYCVNNGKHSKWFHSDGHKQTYIPKAQRAFAEKLALKKYYTLLEKELRSEITALEFYLRHHSNNHKSEQLLSEPGYQELLSSFFQPKSQELLNWNTESYERNIKYPEHLIHKTSSGIFVRSKSEALIDMVLYTNKIPFRYECALQLGNILLYPDFTIRHPKTGDLYYWEHFGLIDDSNYSNNSISKLQLYISHGIIPTINLITTYETKNHPLQIETIEKIVHDYFL